MNHVLRAIMMLTAAIVAISSHKASAGETLSSANRALIYGTPEAVVGAGRPAGPIRLGPGPHLLLDEKLIESSEGITRRVNSPKRDTDIPNPIVTGPADRCFQPYFTVSRAPETGTWRIWYGAWREDKSMSNSHLAYMESDDGIHWRRPPKILKDPGPLQFGSEVLDEGPGAAEPAGRYKYSWWHSGGLRIAVSADGLDFSPLSPDVVLPHGHDINNIWRDPIRNRYVATVSEMLQLENMDQPRRTTLQATSQDLLHWTPKQIVLAGDKRYDKNVLQFYAMNGYLARGDLVIGLAKNLHDDWRADGAPQGAFGIGSSSLVWTRDGETWVRDREVFFGPDPAPGAWDHAHAWIDEQVPVGDEVYLYYGGYRWGHKHNRFEDRQIGLVKMLRDRYVAREAGSGGGWLRTPPLALAGSQLTINARIDGELKVGIVGADGDVLPGFDWVSLRGDKVDHQVTFQGNLRQLAETPIRIEFRLRDAQLFGFDLKDDAAGSSATPASWNLVCSSDNDLYRVLTGSAVACRRFDKAREAIAAAAVGTAVLILADEYPEHTTSIPPEALAEATRKRLRWYIEYPGELPGLEPGPPQRSAKQRAVVTSEFFGPALPAMQILAIHDCAVVPLKSSPGGVVHLAWATVAGVDRAVYGLRETPSQPLLFDCGEGCLAAATKLSGFVTGRSMPHEAWAAVWKTILGHLQPGKPLPTLKWTPTVRPSYTREEPLPADAESRAIVRLAEWYFKSRVLRHPQWPEEALDWASTYNTVRDAPQADWPRGDGSLGMLEGYSSTIRADGSQPMRYAVRNDCNCESAMALAFAGRVNGPKACREVAANLLDYTLLQSPLAGGPRADPKSSSYGLVGWALDHPGSYYGDDNARALLGVLAAARLLGQSRWDEPVARCLLANLRTTGPNGYRQNCVTDDDLQKRGWQSYWQKGAVLRSPHYEAWLWACFLWAYRESGFPPFLERSKAGFDDLMRAYPDQWYWVIRSGQIERARALLPMAWLVRTADTPEHRAWLRRIAEDVIACQDACGAVRERLGGVAHGVGANREYGTGEVSIIQEDGDPLSDMLYTCNFAAIGLHEAAAATGDPVYADAEDKLVEFLCRIQIRSEAHPELDGAWYRAFDYRRWDYWASNADWEWGPWCVESGWTQPWIAATLALRQMKTSLWELTAGSGVAAHLHKYREQMLPAEDGGRLPK